MRAAIVVLSFSFLIGAPRLAHGQTADNLLLVINDNSPDSAAVGGHYTAVRHVVENHTVHVHVPATDTISRAEYERLIETPVEAQLASHGLQDRILYIVLTKGIPLRIAGTGGPDGATASVDSELTLLYRKAMGATLPVAGHVANPYYLGEKPLSAAQRFTRFNSDLYLVTRLDGFAVGDVMGLIDRAAAPVSAGKIVLDQKATVIDRGGDQWLQEAADRLKQTSAADRVLLENTRARAATTEAVIGYYSWGSNDPAGQPRRSGFTFSPGAIGATFVSTDGRTFSEPSADWAPSGPNGGPVFAGSFQSLAGDLIRDGITGVAAHVNEPYLDATIRPQILFPAYIAGFNLAESFYLAMPYLSWQTVVIGDPLCSPFPRTPLTPGEIDRGLDPETGLPALLTTRRLAVAAQAGLNQEAVKLMLRLEADLAHKDGSRVEQLLVRATDLEPRLTTAQNELAELYASRREYDKSIARYRLVVAAEPDNTTALNNLAYFLAVYGHAPGEALSFAQHAYRLSPYGAITDTLGWIHHLLGDDNVAVSIIELAESQLPRSTEVLVHAATIHAALKQHTRALSELDAAVKLDPSMAQQPSLKTLREQLAQP